MSATEASASDNSGIEAPAVVSCGPGIWYSKGEFFLGDKQTNGLTYKGIRSRLLEMLKKHLEVLTAGPHNESTARELEEERARIEEVASGAVVPFALDTTMTIVARSPAAQSGGKGERLPAGAQELVLISPVPARQAVVEAVRALGTVSAIVAPNVQHWLFVAEWARLFPQAKIFCGPDAPGDALGAKLAPLSSEALVDGGHQLSATLDQRWLRGATLCMNEFAFFHRPSATLVVSDGFYGGYPQDAPAWQQPGWFGRVWFKLTKGGSFRKPTLPIYRTSRVGSGGDPAALAQAVAGISRDWAFSQIVFAHGAVPYRGGEAGDARTAFRAAWFQGCSLPESD